MKRSTVYLAANTAFHFRRFSTPERHNRIRTNGKTGKGIIPNQTGKPIISPSVKDFAIRSNYNK